MKTVKVEDWYHEFLKEEKRDDETMSEALVRLTGGPSPPPDLVAGVISDEDGEAMLDAIESADASSATEVAERLNDDS